MVTEKLDQWLARTTVNSWSETFDIPYWWLNQKLMCAYGTNLGLFGRVVEVRDCDVVAYSRTVRYFALPLLHRE